MIRVFLSYSSLDEKLARGICDYLEQNGVNCWAAYKDIRPNELYAKQIMSAMAQCHCLLFLLTQNSNNSTPILSELERATTTQHIPIVTIKQGAFTVAEEIMFYIARRQFITITDKCSPFYNIILQTVRSTINVSSYNDWIDKENDIIESNIQIIENQLNIVKRKQRVYIAVAVCIYCVALYALLNSSYLTAIICFFAGAIFSFMSMQRNSIKKISDLYLETEKRNASVQKGLKDKYGTMFEEE